MSIKNFFSDGFAGLSVAGVLLPEAVIYASIAGITPVHAFIAALCGLLIYPFIGSSRFAIVSPTSSAAAIFASAVAAGGTDWGFALVGTTAIFFLLAALFNAEFLSSFISRPVLRGFAWGLAVTIVLKQIPHLLGVHIEASNTVFFVRDVVQNLNNVHWPSLFLGLAGLACWFILRYVVQRILPLPSSFIVLVLGILWIFFIGNNRYNIALVGYIEWKNVHIGIPHLNMEQWLRVAQFAPALLLILFAESWGSVRSLALQNGDIVNSRQELATLGLSNLMSGLLQGLPVGAGFSAASTNQSAGAKSKLAGVFSAMALILLLWLGRNWLAYLPMPILSAVVIGILSHNLWPRSVIESLHLGKDAWLAIFTAIAVLIFGVLFGMLVAVALSVILAIRHFSEPLVVEIARLPGTHDFLDQQQHSGLEPPVRGILLMRPEEPLFFANAETILKNIQQRIQTLHSQIVIISMEMCDDLDSTTVEAIG